MVILCDGVVAGTLFVLSPRSPGHRHLPLPSPTPAVDASRGRLATPDGASFVERKHRHVLLLPPLRAGGVVDYRSTLGQRQ